MNAQHSFHTKAKTSTSTTHDEKSIEHNDKNIHVHKYTEDPHEVWCDLVHTRKVVHEQVQPLPHDRPIYPDKLRFVCISDTHAATELMQPVPCGDVLIHAGDFCYGCGSVNEIQQFNEFLDSLAHKRKIVIAGNHETVFDEHFWGERLCHRKMERNFREVDIEMKKHGLMKPSQLLKNCTYLEDSGVEMCGVHIYGSPWQPVHAGWGFNLRRGEQLLEKWRLIPDHTDVLVTHCPPLGYGDCVGYKREHVGCVELLTTVQHRVKPKYHVYGHIHEGHGITTNGVTTFINAAICDEEYRTVHSPIIFDLDIPEGHSKQELKWTTV